MTRKIVIAIDGPSASGKSTVGRRLAKRLGYRYLDTGAMYRVAALKAKELSIDSDDEDKLARVCAGMEIVFVHDGNEIKTFCNGKDVSEAIRKPEISALASEISSKKAVRDILVEMQRRMGAGGGVVAEGRDIGTVVFTEAELKFFLDSKPEERGKRRFEELMEKGIRVSLEETVAEMKGRDQRDRRRKLSPLHKAEDALVIDSTHMTIDGVVEKMLEEARRRISQGGNCQK
ncbi:MAG: (d)CMP kinase [Syntrophobacterales bacterium]|nr:MAG: (d)CMP kinase [Syntrophobacterales bacterium]